MACRRLMMSLVKLVLREGAVSLSVSLDMLMILFLSILRGRFESVNDGLDGHLKKVGNLLPRIITDIKQGCDLRFQIGEAV